MIVREVMQILAGYNPDDVFDPDDLLLPRCEVPGCRKPAEYEGWVRVRDFTGTPTGVIQRRCVCEEHTNLTIAKETGDVV